MQVATSLDSRTERMSKNRHPLQSRRKQDDAQDQSSLSDRPSYGPWTAIKTVIHRCMFRPDMRHLQESRCYERDGNLNLDGDGEGDFIQSSLTHSKNQRQEPARRGGLKKKDSPGTGTGNVFHRRIPPGTGTGNVLQAS